MISTESIHFGLRLPYDTGYSHLYEILSVRNRGPRYHNLTILFAAWLLICLLGALEILLTYLFSPETIHSPKFFWAAITRILTGFAAICFVLYPGYLYLKNKSMGQRLTGHFILLIIYVFVYLLFSVGQFQLVFKTLTIPALLSGMWQTTLSDFHHIASYYFFLLFILIWRDYYEDKTNALIKQEQLEAELAKTRFIVLQRQIQPHFLFNSLNNIVAIIDEKKETAQEMLVDLSELLRKSVAMDFSQKITLAEELEITRLYLSIEKNRFEHQLEFHFKTKRECESIPFPPFLLQPLVENAIKHGFKGSIKKLTLIIESVIEEKVLLVRVKNNGAPLKIRADGIGIKNVQDRLLTSYGTQSSHILRNERNWIVNEIKILL